MTRFLHDVRHGVRLLTRHPGFAAIAILSIAFGTGANVAIFSVADTLLLRPLPVNEPNQLLTVGVRVKRGIGILNNASYPDYVDLRDRSVGFSGLAAFVSNVTSFTLQPGSSAQVRFATAISSNYFQVLGVELALGRSFSRDEEAHPDRSHVVVLGYGMWQADYAADPHVIGRTLRVAGIECEIVGVAPEPFWGLNPRYIPEAAFIPLALWPSVASAPVADPLEARAYRALTLKGRLRPGMSLADVQAELQVIGKDLERAWPASNLNQVLVAQSEFDTKIARDPLTSRTLVLLTILSVAVLLVACANVAGLLASRAPVRAREIALRLAIGAGRGRVVRQLMTESLAIALAGGLGGVGVGAVGINLLRQIHLPSDVVALPQMVLDERTFVFSLVLAMASAFVFGLVPALQTTRVDLLNSLKAGEQEGARRRLIGRHTLVTVQVSLSLVLLTLALFTVQFVARELTEGPGFRVTQAAKVTIDPSQAGYARPASARFVAQLLERVRQLPSVQSASAASGIPMRSFELASIVPEGYRMPEGQAIVQIPANRVDDDYFRTMEIPILAGRTFGPGDSSETPPVAVVNERLASHYWPAGDAIGRRFRLGDDQGPLVEIVGVARLSKYWFSGEAPQDAVYFSWRQQPRGRVEIVAATSGDSAALLTPLRNTIRELDPDVPVYDALTMEAFYDARVTSIGHVLTRLVGGMGLMGMILTMVGLYGLVSYAVSRRTREIGIRMAIGASHGRVLRMILKQGMTPAVIGLVIGVALSTATLQILPAIGPLDYQFDGGLFMLVVPALLVVTALAAFVPARRAAQVSPTVALRCD